MNDTASKRIVHVDGVRHFRDLGGYAVTPDGTTRWKRLYRSATLDGITWRGLVTLRELGIRTVIDLRHDAERNTTVYEPLATMGIRIVQFPLSLTHESRIGDADLLHSDPILTRVFTRILDQSIHEAWTNQRMKRALSVASVLVSHTLGNLYLDLINSQKTVLSTVVEQLCDDSNLPAVMHCARGRDRTGVVSALILSGLGVLRRHVTEDYLLSGIDWASGVFSSYKYQLMALDIDPPQMETGFGVRASALSPLYAYMDASGGAENILRDLLGGNEKAFKSLSRLLIAEDVGPSGSS